MGTTTVTQINATPDELVAMLIEKIIPLMPSAPVADELLTVDETMKLIKIKSRVGFQSWCVENKVHGKPVGKRKMFLKSKVLAAFNR